MKTTMMLTMIEQLCLFILRSEIEMLNSSPVVNVVQIITLLSSAPVKRLSNCNKVKKSSSHRDEKKNVRRKMMIEHLNERSSWEKNSSPFSTPSHSKDLQFSSFIAYFLASCVIFMKIFLCFFHFQWIFFEFSLFSEMAVFGVHLSSDSVLIFLFRAR